MTRQTSALLSHALQANAIFSGASGLLLLLVPGWWAGLIGVLPAPAYAALGAALLAFAGLVWWTARRPDTWRLLVLWIVAADALWVLATPIVMLLGAEAVSPAGHLLLATVALAVAILSALQWQGLKRFGTLP